MLLYKPWWTTYLGWCCILNFDLLGYVFIAKFYSKTNKHSQSDPPKPRAMIDAKEKIPFSGDQRLKMNFPRT